jgi:hypothetical protein
MSQRERHRPLSGTSPQKRTSAYRNFLTLQNMDVGFERLKEKIWEKKKKERNNRSA